MKAIMFILSSVALAGTAAAQDAQTLLQSAQMVMGIQGMKSMRLEASGYLADTGEAAGGDAPHPFVKDYDADIDFATPSMRLRIHRTNPDGTALTYGSEEIQFLSGTYAWDQYPGEKRGPIPPPGPAQNRAGAPPGGGAPPAGPPAGSGDAGGRVYARTLPQLAAARRMQTLLTPPGFILAALANNASVTTAGASKLVSFSTSDGHRYTGTFNGANLLTKIVTTDPLTERMLEVSFSQYKAFAGTRLPSHIVQTEGRAPTADLSVSDVRPNRVTALAVPPYVQQAVQTDRPRD